MWEDKDSQVKDVINTLEKIIEKSSNNDEIKSIMKSISKLEVSKKKIFDLYIEEYITKAEFKKKNDEINIKLNNYILQQDNFLKDDLYLQDKTTRIKRVNDFFNQDMKDVSSVSNALIENMIERIIVYPDRKMDVTLNGRVFPSVSAVRED